MYACSMLTAVCLLGLSPLAVSANALSRVGNFVPSLSFTESRTERILNRSNPDFPQFSFPEASALTRTELRLVANMSGQSLDSIDADTSISLSFGDLSVDFQLGDDPTYAIGKRSIFIPVSGWNDQNEPVGSDGLRLSWSETALTLSLTFNSDEDSDHGLFGPALAPSFVGEQDSSIRVLSDLQLTFGDLEADAVCFVAGSATTSSPKVRFGGFEEVIPVTQVQLTASLDITPPEVRVRTQAATVQAANARERTSTEQAEPQCSLCGSSSDARGVVAVRIKLPTAPGEEEEWVEAELEEMTVPIAPDEWGRTAVNWSLPIEAETRLGQITYTVVAEDLAGNLSAPISFTIVNELPDSLVGRWDSAVVDGDSIATGSLTLMVNKLGKVSGLYRNLQGRFPFVGDWVGDGIQAQIFTKAGVLPLQLQASASTLEFEDLSDLELYGVLLSGNANPEEDSSELVGEFWASRSPYGARNPLPEERVGRFHGSLSGAEAYSEHLSGDSLLVMITQKNGSVSLVGSLADGTSWTWAGPCGATGDVAMMQYLYGNKGMIAGTISNDGESMTGDGLRWVRPASPADLLFSDGFSADGLTLDGVRYVAPTASEIPLGLAEPEESGFNTFLDLNGASLGVPLSLELTLGLRGKFTFPSPNELKLRASLNNSTGLMSGSAALGLADGGTSRASFRGLVVGSEIRGFYVGSPTATGGVRHLGLMRVNSESNDNGDGGGDTEQEDWWWWWQYFCEISWRGKMPADWPEQWRWWWTELVTIY